MNRTTRIDHAYLRFECRLPVGAVRTGLRAACTSRAFGGPGWSDGRLALFRPARTARCPACRLSDSAHRSRRPARPQPDRRTPARTGRHRARPAPGGQRQSSPLYTDGAGRFVRPYAFGHGSNGVQVGSADGKILKRVQFYEANRSQLPPRVRVVLGWDDPKAELDLHIVTPDGQHAYWRIRA